MRTVMRVASERGRGANPAGSARGRGQRPPRSVVFTLGATLAGVAGCAPGVQWRLDGFEAVHADARRAGALTLVYVRAWYSVACTQVEESVFNQPAMKAATRGMACAQLELDWADNRRIAERWGIDTVPAYVIVNADGQVVAREVRTFSLESVLAAIGRARQGLATAPATTP